MDELGLGAGLAALAFWGFIAAAVVASYWNEIRKREAQHETIRRAIESDRQLDEEFMEKLAALNDSGNDRVDRDFKVTALWILPISGGMVVFALFLGMVDSQARVVMLGVAGLLAVLGVGFLAAAKYTERWYQ